MVTSLTSARPLVAFVDGHLKGPFFDRLRSALLAEMDADCRSVSPPGLLDPDFKADLVIVNDETWPFCAAGLAELHRRSIPSLHLADGIAEWRNTWENPRQASDNEGMPLFQPILADKIACMGWSQARVLASLGNAEKCEVTGSPRYDSIVRKELCETPAGKKKKLLITTAQSPGFTPDQIESVRCSLNDLKSYLRGKQAPFEAIWRVADEVAEVADGANTFGRVPLQDQMQVVDAVISTPSSVQVDAMMSGLPVALLDYGNRPAFVPAAWTITAAEQLGPTLRILADPSPQRMLYQEMVLHDTLECRGPATPRVLALARGMIESGRHARLAGKALSFPVRMLEQVMEEPTGVEYLLAMDQLHPAHSVFRLDDRVALQAELGHLRKAMQTSLVQKIYRKLCQLGVRQQ